MDLAQALVECADLLATAGSVLKRIAQSEAPAEQTTQAHLDEVLQIATRLEEISQNMSAAARDPER